MSTAYNFSVVKCEVEVANLTVLSGWTLNHENYGGFTSISCIVLMVVSDGIYYQSPAVIHMSRTVVFSMIYRVDVRTVVWVNLGGVLKQSMSLVGDEGEEIEEKELRRSIS